MAAEQVPVGPVGYIGYGLVYGYPVRGMSFNVKAHQQVFNGDPASNIPDQPIWYVGPLEVDGDVSWPVVVNDPVTYKIIQVSLTKINQGKTGANKTLETGDIECRFPGSTGMKPYTRTAKTCMINRLSFKATSGERVEASINVIGLGLSEDHGELSKSDSGLFDMGRILTWNDVSVVARKGTDDSSDENVSWKGCTVKEFNFEVNNNVTRANTYCWPESADTKGTDITATALVLGRRQVSGSLTFLGSASTQAAAVQNINTETSDSELAITFGTVQAKFHRVVYELQQIDLTSGVIYGRTSFTAHGDGPGAPSVEFVMDKDNEEAWNQAMKDLDQGLSRRKL